MTFPESSPPEASPAGGKMLVGPDALSEPQENSSATTSTIDPEKICGRFMCLT
jgi:hypothetical protein